MFGIFGLFLAGVGGNKGVKMWLYAQTFHFLLQKAKQSKRVQGGPVYFVNCCFHELSLPLPAGGDLSWLPPCRQCRRSLKRVEKALCQAAGAWWCLADGEYDCGCRPGCKLRVKERAETQLVWCTARTEGFFCLKRDKCCSCWSFISQHNL